jgi:hypothetical protein
MKMGFVDCITKPLDKEKSIWGIGCFCWNL